MHTKTDNEKILVGNAFPMTLIRRHAVSVSELPVDELVAKASHARTVSFWGHENTRGVAESLLGTSIRPASPRPAIMLDGEDYPTLDGVRFTECYVLSPDYRSGFRPAIGEEVDADDIDGWHVLRLVWTD